MRVPSPRPAALGLCTLLALAAGAPAAAQEPDDAAEEEAEPVATYPLSDIDLVVRVPTGLDEGWAPPPWMIEAEESLALQKKGHQLVALFEGVQRIWQPRFTAETAQAQGEHLAQQFLDGTYAGPELGETTWESFTLVESPTLGDIIRADALVELPALEDQLSEEAEDGVRGRLTLLLFPVRDGHDALAIVGVGDEAELQAAVDDLTAMMAFYDGPRPWSDMPTGRVEDAAGYSLQLPEGWRGLVENERLALKGEPVGGNSGYGGALSYQYYFDPTSIEGAEGFGCAAWSSETLEVVAPAKAPKLADNYRLAARLILKEGAYQVDGGKPIRGRNADLLDGRPIVVEPGTPGELAIMSMGDRDAYMWSVDATRVSAGGEEQPVSVRTFYTAYGDVNLHCQVAAPADDADAQARLDAFSAAMESLEITDAEQFPMTLGLMAQYKRWWPYTNPLLQLYWLPVPIVFFAAWLASRGED